MTPGDERRRALLDRRLARAGLAGTDRGNRRDRVPPRPDPDRAPLSFAQLQAWEHQRRRPDSVSNTLCLVLDVRPAGPDAGPVDENALAEAFQHLARRHEILRTTYHADTDGTPYQRIHPDLPVPVHRVDLRGAGAEALDRLAADAAAEPFDLAIEGPLRVTLARRGDTELAVVLVVQHIVWDGATFGVLSAELSRGYRRESAAPLAVQYGDVAVWQRARWAESGHGAAARAYWHQRLTPPPAGTYLPVDRTPPEHAGERGGRVDRRLAPDVAAALRHLAERHRTTLFTAFLVCWCAVLHRDGGPGEVTVGTLVAARDEPETQPLVGNFGNPVALRLDTAGDPTVTELLRRADGERAAAFRHQDYPFERLVDELGARQPSGRPPFFDSLLVFVAQQTAGPRLAGATVRWWRVDTGAAQFPLVPLGVEVFALPDGLEVQATYSHDVLDADTVERLLADLERVVVRAADDPDLPLSGLREPVARQ